MLYGVLTFLEFPVTDDTPTKSTREQIQEIPAALRKKAQNIFRKKILYKRLPILTWLPKYNTEDAIGDAIAGITVGEFKLENEIF